MSEPPNRKVNLPGHGVFWFHEESDGTGELTPLDHCNKVGDIVDAYIAIFEDSYAHVCKDGKIRRYRQVIGCREDLKPAEVPG